MSSDADVCENCGTAIAKFVVPRIERKVCGQECGQTLWTAARIGGLIVEGVDDGDAFRGNNKDDDDELAKTEARIGHAQLKRCVEYVNGLRVLDAALSILKPALDFLKPGSDSDDGGENEDAAMALKYANGWVRPWVSLMRVVALIAGAERFEMMPDTTEERVANYLLSGEDAYKLYRVYDTAVRRAVHAYDNYLADNHISKEQESPEIRRKLDWFFEVARFVDHWYGVDGTPLAYDFQAPSRLFPMLSAISQTNRLFTSWTLGHKFVDQYGGFVPGQQNPGKTKLVMTQFPVGVLPLPQPLFEMIGKRIHFNPLQLFVGNASRTHEVLIVQRVNDPSTDQSNETLRFTIGRAFRDGTSADELVYMPEYEKTVRFAREGFPLLYSTMRGKVGRAKFQHNEETLNKYLQTASCLDWRPTSGNAANTNGSGGNTEGVEFATLRSGGIGPRHFLWLLELQRITYDDLVRVLGSTTVKRGTEVWHSKAYVDRFLLKHIPIFVSHDRETSMFYGRYAALQNTTTTAGVAAGTSANNLKRYVVLRMRLRRDLRMLDATSTYAFQFASHRTRFYQYGRGLVKFLICGGITPDTLLAGNCSSLNKNNTASKKDAGMMTAATAHIAVRVDDLISDVDSFWIQSLGGPGWTWNETRELDSSELMVTNPPEFLEVVEKIVYTRTKRAGRLEEVDDEDDVWEAQTFPPDVPRTITLKRSAPTSSDDEETKKAKNVAEELAGVIGQFINDNA
jgi:hypothetical protein